VLPVARDAVGCEGYRLQADAQQLAHEYGYLMTIRVRDETEVTRDAYRSVVARTEPTAIAIYALPIDYQPNERKMEKAGIRERVDAIATTPYLDWSDAGMTFKQIEAIRSTVVIDGQVFEIKEKSLTGPVGQRFIYVNLGLVKQ
jgi:hypothetical protein